MFMNTHPSDLSLQLALAKMLPDKLKITHGVYQDFVYWLPSTTRPVKETEWLHVCWLIEQAIDGDVLVKARYRVFETKNKNHEAFAHLDNVDIDSFLLKQTWQEHALVICQVKGVEV